MGINPFDADNGFLILAKLDEQHSVWPAVGNAPTSWRAVYGEAAPAACLEHIDQRWTDIRPLRPRERLPAGRVSEK
ncbi:protein mbtH [Mycobacterium sp. 852002-51163_SCH5372311]|uniref:MbtH family protein n=1 Tax=Mycobacterium sp. 852002-51163_SCH5372311 TaxID=1834097 RepID=UPI0007FB8C5B|nr:MbtH family NRPS accessory protein [Mycobacterium sp. 852002-51163_SCH5372311]OBF83983.1 protein mbtH [Mycobacterium sp. 852002-51163_SCH5372311]